MTRAYTVAEIDMMRALLHRKLDRPRRIYGGWEEYMLKISHMVEDRLRTYMTGGVEPEDLKKEVEEYEARLETAPAGGQKTWRKFTDYNKKWMA